MIFCVLLSLVNWQQQISYEIDGYLNTDEHSFTATERLIYHNNSPYSLDTLYLHLYANAYRDARTYYAREAYKMGKEEYVNAKSDARGYIDITRVIVDDMVLQYSIEETIMTVVLNRVLETGDSVVLHIAFYVNIPRGFVDFGYWSGHYEMTQWYPKICVFDEAGWRRDQLHPLGSNLREFGTYDVTVELPGDYVIAATGRLVNSVEQGFIDTLAVSREKLPRGGRKRVRFHAENVHDFAWVCSGDLGLKQYNILNTNVNIFYRPDNGDDAETTYRYAFDAISRFTEWFGQYPYGDLNFVDGYYQGNDIYPQMVITGVNEDLVTRLFEAAIVTKIGKQWFSGAIGIDGVHNAWLGEGFATYAAIRYMEDKYGKDNTLIKAPLLPPLSLKYIHQFYYYLNQTNGLEKPLSTPAYEYADVPISYQNSAISKPALFLLSLEKTIGTEIFDRAVQQYYQTYSFRHAQPYDFIKICEEVSGKDLAEIFDSFLNTTEFCDWAVNGVSGNKVMIENMGNFKWPIDLHATTDSGEYLYYINGLEKKYTILIPDSMGEVSKVALDPHEYTLDPNYWNNYSPRKVSIKPIFDFDWPSFSTYQIVWSPYLWYNSYDGVKAGFYLFGDNFADVDFVKGGYQVTAGYNHGFGSKRHYPLLNYQTPVLFKDGKRVRIRFSGSRSLAGDNVSLGITSNLGRPFTRQPQISITNALSFNRLSTYSGLDSIDWDLGRNIAFDNNITFRNNTINAAVVLSLAHHTLGSEWEYLKMIVEARRSFAFAIPFSARFFVGKIFGEAPTQEQLFLSGALRANLLANLLFGQSGTYSPQERIHIPGHGSMRGYQTLHIKSDKMYVFNLEFPTHTLIRVFTDIGYYDKFAFDTGLCLAIGSETFPFLPLYGLSISANFPLYSYIEGEPWKLRWSFGFSL